MKALFHPYFNAESSEDLLGYPHFWVGDRYADPIRYLKSKAKEHGIDMSSTKFCDMTKADVFFFWERPRTKDDLFRYALASGKPLYLLATEPPTVIAENYSEENTLIFDKIFTWANNSLDDKNKISIKPIYFSFPQKPSSVSFKKRNFCCIIASIYTREKDPYELYSKRAETVIWFEKNHPTKLDFFGRSNRYTNTNFSVYKGEVDKKDDVLEQYRFAICYENSYGSLGYISEKIFDCFFAGTIPIYLGCTDVDTYIPSDLFIDRRNFSSYEALYSYLENITEEEYNNYIAKTNEFLKTPFAQSYNEKALAKIILNTCFDREI